MYKLYSYQMFLNLNFKFVVFYYDETQNFWFTYENILLHKQTKNNKFVITETNYGTGEYPIKHFDKKKNILIGSCNIILYFDYIVSVYNTF